MTQPQPGDIWEHKSGERRQLLVQVTMHGVYYSSDGCETWWSARDWDEWQSGATLIERKEPNDA